MDRWTLQDHLIIEDLMKVYRGPVVEKVLLFKECLFQLFNNVRSREEALHKRDELYEQTWWRSSWHLTKVMQLLMSPNFPIKTLHILLDNFFLQCSISFSDYLTVLWAGVVLCLVFTWRLENSRLGRTFEAIKTSNMVSATLDLNTIYYKIIAFGLGGAGGGVDMDRIFTEEELKEMGTQTMEAAIAAVEAGDKERAKELIKRMDNESQAVLDTFMNWTLDLMDYIYVHDGVEALERALRKPFGRREEGRIESYQKMDFRSQVQSLAGSLRPLHQTLEITEDDEKVCVKMNRCGTGQRMLESGAYDPPRNASRMKPHRLTWGLPNFPVYCSHAPLQEILCIEKIGRPLVVHWFPDEVAIESCRFCLYKDPKRIPEEVYRRVGMKKPK